MFEFFRWLLWDRQMYVRESRRRAEKYLPKLSDKQLIEYALDVENMQTGCVPVLCKELAKRFGNKLSQEQMADIMRN